MRYANSMGNLKREFTDKKPTTVTRKKSVAAMMSKGGQNLLVSTHSINCVNMSLTPIISPQFNTIQNQRSNSWSMHIFPSLRIISHEHFNPQASFLVPSQGTTLLGHS